MRILLGAFGDPGHAFPMIALGKRLVENGHDVTLQTWGRWQQEIESEGINFSAAPEYHVFPTRENPLKPYQAIIKATNETRPLIQALNPQVVVADILTLAPALASELAGLPVATLIPHLYPVNPDDSPPFGLGAMPPSSNFGRRIWRKSSKLFNIGAQIGRAELNETRHRLGLPVHQHFHGGISRQLALVATYPQLEFRRAWPPYAHIVGPLFWEPKCEPISLRPCDQPRILIAPSTSKDPQQKLLKTAIAGLADLPVEVIATTNKPDNNQSFDLPSNTKLVNWLSYSQTMPRCDLVVTHGGHGTITRALSCGCSVIVCPVDGDMYENAARVQWAKLGGRIPPRLLAPRTIKSVVSQVLEDELIKRNVYELANRDPIDPNLPIKLIEQLGAVEVGLDTMVAGDPR